MKTQNSVQLIGYLGCDPIIKTRPDGTSLARIRLATDFYRKNEDGSIFRKTTWHEVIAWNRLAEKVTGQFIKGSHILVEGSIEYRTYEDKAGHTRYITEIRASKLLNLDR